MRFADEIISLKDGRLSSQLPSDKEISLDESEPLGDDVTFSGPIIDIEDKELSENKKDDESRLKGGSGVYRFYLQRSGIGAVVCFIGAMTLEAACGNTSCNSNYSPFLGMRGC